MSDLSFYDRTPRPWANGRLSNLSIVGHTTTTAVRIWARSWQEGRYWLAITTESLSTDAVRDRVLQAVIQADAQNLVFGTMNGVVLQVRKTTFATDLTTLYDVSGLTPNTQYYYAVVAAPGQQPVPWETGGDGRCVFRTADDASTSVQFGLYSCHMPYPKNGGIRNMDMWTRFGTELAERRADFVIGCGDQIYTDGNKSVSIWEFLKKHKDELPKSRAQRLAIMESWYRDLYRGYWGHVEVRAVFERFPNYMIWDDHEIMDGWGSYTKKELANQLDTLWELEDRKANVRLAQEMFETARKVYTEYQHSHNPPTLEGVFDYAFTRGLCAFYVMDMRGQRNYGSRGGFPILGAAQAKRILEWLKLPATRQAAAVFIVSSVPVIHITSFVANTFDLSFLGLADDLRDEWEHRSNWKERDILLDAVFAFSLSTGKKVVFLSGDVHIGGAFRLKAKEKYAGAQVYQLTSSAITYCRAPGGLLEAATKEAGTLGSHKDSPVGKVNFERLRVFNRNNFGIVKVEQQGGNTSIAWDLYGNTDQAEELVRLSRVSL